MKANTSERNSDGLLKVTTSVLVKTLRALLKDPYLVPCVFGPAGIGKSSITSQIAEIDFSGNMNDTRLGQMQEEDMTGIPSIVDNRTVYNLPFFFPDEGKGLWFFDEVNRAKKGMLQCLFQLILDRKYFNYTLPADWRMLFAGNWSPKEAIYQVEDLDPALRSRMCMLYYTGPTYSEWKAWALSAGVADQIVSFLSIHQNLLVTESADDKPSPNPRTWEKGSRVLKVTDDYDARRIALSGFLGLESTVMLLNYIENEYDALPDVQDLKKAASVITTWVSKKKNDRVTGYITSIADHINEGGDYEKTEFKTFVQSIPKEFAFSLLKAINTEQGKHLIECVFNLDNGLFDDQLFSFFETGAIK